MFRAWVAVAVATSVVVGIAFGCADAMSPGSPEYTPDPTPEASAPPTGTGHAGKNGLDGGSDADAYAVCPPALDASYTDLLTRVFSTSSCGTDNPLSCHSPSGADASGSWLDFTLDAAAVYAELLGADGGGQVARNIGVYGPPVYRIVPFEAGASQLYVKLTLTDGASPVYGAGMPLTAPGSVCPEALSAVAAWIEAGAPQN
jgi:hypothetical protein